MRKISSKYLDIVLNASIRSACLSSERDIIKFLRYQNRNKSATRGAQLKYFHINKKREKSTLSAFFTLLSLELFYIWVEKAAVLFDNIFNLMFLLCFSIIRWNFGIFLLFCQRGSVTVGRMDIN